MKYGAHFFPVLIEVFGHAKTAFIFVSVPYFFEYLHIISSLFGLPVNLTFCVTCLFTRIQLLSLFVIRGLEWRGSGASESRQTCQYRTSRLHFISVVLFAQSAR